MRVYGGSENRLYNPELGYYVIATSHIDRAECPLPFLERFRWSGRSETAERRFADLAPWGSAAVQRNQLDLLNKIPLYGQRRRQGRHVLENNGLATTIRVP
jgi:hypothetical protein